MLISLLEASLADWAGCGKGDRRCRSRDPRDESAGDHTRNPPKKAGRGLFTSRLPSYISDVRRLFVTLAFVAALLAGWTPAMAASLHAAAVASEHADYRADNEHAHHGDQKHKAVHPLLCSACFAVVAEAARIAPPLVRPTRPVAISDTLTGGYVLPLEPPPRSPAF